MYFVKYRKIGSKRYLFLTSNGRGNSLRIHAAQFHTKETALAFIAENQPDNPDFEFIAVPICKTSKLPT